jgi:cyclohexyl-isocyanide hydratase
MKNDKPPIKIGIPLYTNFDSLDVLGAFQTFSFQTPEMDPILIGPTMDPVPSWEGVQILPKCDFASCPQLDVLFVPGGVDLQDVLTPPDVDENPYLRFLLEQASGDLKLVTSVCVGAILLASAGLLDGYTATTHWAFQTVLAEFPNVLLASGYPRYVIDANRVTGGGISSSLDESLAISAILLGDNSARLAQLKMQYAPQPPFHDGDPAQAGPVILQEASAYMRDGVDKLRIAVRRIIDR